MKTQTWIFVLLVFFGTVPSHAVMVACEPDASTSGFDGGRLVPGGHITVRMDRVDTSWPQTLVDFLAWQQLDGTFFEMTNMLGTRAPYVSLTTSPLGSRLYLEMDFEESDIESIALSVAGDWSVRENLKGELTVIERDTWILNGPVICSVRDSN